MSLCVILKINFFVTKLYDNMLVSKSKIMMIHDISITEVILIKTRFYTNDDVAVYDNMCNKNLLHKLMTFCLKNVLIL